MKIFGLALALIVAFCPVGAEVMTDHAVGVMDGDTITMLDADNLPFSSVRRPVGN